MDKVNQELTSLLEAMKGFFEPLQAVKGESGTLVIEGYMTRFNNVDKDGHVMLPPAFDEFIARFHEEVAKNPRFLPLLFSHRWHAKLGYVKDLRNDGHGVLVTAVIEENTPEGRYAANLVRSKDITGLSHHFYNGLGFRRDGIMYITKADLMEVSLALNPRNELALIKRFSDSKDLYKGWKGMVQNFLRTEAGLSENEARLMFADGVKAFDFHEEEKITAMRMILEGLETAKES